MSKEIKLSEVKIGKTFKGKDGVERILLDFLPDGKALTLTADNMFTEIFDRNSNNYANSHIRKRLEEEVLPEVEKAFGYENVCELELDLLSEDGLDTYGKIKTKCSLLTSEQYRKYTRLISNHKVNHWWWLATPDSTTERNDDVWVRCVSGSGYLFNGSCCNDFGVCAVFIFKSDIFVFCD